MYNIFFYSFLYTVLPLHGWRDGISFLVANRPYAGGVASRLATTSYVAMVTPILYDNFYSPNDSNLKYESYRPYG